jgi:dipeptidyl-peptidase 4
MKKTCFLLAMACWGVLCTSAQDKMLSLEDAMLKARTSLAPENLRQLQFVHGTGDYVYLKKMPGENGADVWMRGNFKQAAEQVWLTLDQLNEKVKAAGYEPFKTMPAIQFNQGPYWAMMLDGNRVSYDPLSGKIKIITPKTLLQKENNETSTAGFSAYLEDYNLYVHDGTNARKITSDGSKDIVYASSVHRDEFGISKGTFWSPNGKSLAFYRMDQSMVSDYPIINWSNRPAVNENIKYPMAGDKSHQVTLGVYHTETQQTIYLKTGEPAEQYLTNICWSPDNKFIYIAVVNRAQNHVWLNQYDAQTGNFIKTLFEETDDKYTEPLESMLFLKNNPSQFIWQSKRDGWNHLYLYDASGKQLKQLTKGNWEVLTLHGFDDKNENLFYTSTEESPITRNLYMLNLKKGTGKRLTTGYMAHICQVSSNGQFALDNSSSIHTPRQVQLIEIKTGKTKTLLQAADPLAPYTRGALSVFTINNDNGDSLFCRLYKPVGFDPAKKYPVIVYWYGGPHVQLIGYNWNGNASDYWFQYLAQRGYVVFTLDPRGSDNRGKLFEQAIFRKAGEAQNADLMSGVRYLHNQSWVDKERMGLFGWSYGGFLTTSFMLHHPGIFKAAVAGGPVIDWKYYEIMYTERYMDTPAENPEGYRDTDLTRKAGSLKGKLLLIHGIQDPVVVQQHSVNFVKACVDKGVQVDYMIYPGHEHNVTGKDRVHLYQKVTDYFEQYLKH